MTFCWMRLTRLTYFDEINPARKGIVFRISKLQLWSICYSTFFYIRTLIIIECTNSDHGLFPYNFCLDQNMSLVLQNTIANLFSRDKKRFGLFFLSSHIQNTLGRKNKLGKRSRSTILDTFESWWKSPPDKDLGVATIVHCLWYFTIISHFCWLCQIMYGNFGWLKWDRRPP